MYRTYHEKSIKNDVKSIKKRPKTTPERWKNDSWAFPAPNRAQVGSRVARVIRPYALFMIFRNIIWENGAIFGTPENRWSLQNRTFEGQLGLWPSKNAFREGVREKHENSMKKWCENEGFLMAQNHVWRYTLRLFHTFSVFEKSWKFNAKREARSSHYWSKMRP